MCYCSTGRRTTSNHCLKWRLLLYRRKEFIKKWPLGHRSDHDNSEDANWRIPRLAWFAMMIVGTTITCSSLLQVLYLFVPCEQVELEELSPKNVIVTLTLCKYCNLQKTIVSDPREITRDETFMKFRLDHCVRTSYFFFIERKFHKPTVYTQVMKKKASVKFSLEIEWA